MPPSPLSSILVHTRSGRLSGYISRTHHVSCIANPHAAAPGALGNDDVRQLLHTALRIRQGKAQSSLPEQLIAVFMQVRGAGGK